MLKLVDAVCKNSREGVICADKKSACMDLFLSKSGLIYLLLQLETNGSNQKTFSVS